MISDALLVDTVLPTALSAGPLAKIMTADTEHDAIRSDGASTRRRWRARRICIIGNSRPGEQRAAGGVGLELKPASVLPIALVC
jgi:hypothetical protein